MLLAASKRSGKRISARRFVMRVRQLKISLCNFGGTPTAHGEYKFTYK
jgi:hypothetical protein